MIGVHCSQVRSSVRATRQIRTAVYEVDFLPVENENQDGGKSGDAITIRFTVESTQLNAVVVIDGGRGYTDAP
jgi:hypothetical protein